MKTSRELLALGLPAAALQLLWVSALAIDTAMVARLRDAGDALAGLGYATQVVFLATVPVTALCVATVARVSLHLGAGRPAAARRVVGTALVIALVYSGLVAAAGSGASELLLHAFEPTPEVSAVALDYLGVILMGAVFLHLNMLLASIARAQLDTRTPLYVALFANALNVALNAALIGGVGSWGGLGVAGAALGTVVSQAVGAFVLAGLLRRRSHGLRLVFDRVEARRLLAIAGPVAAELALLNASFLLFFAMVGRFATGAAAAHTVGLRVQAVAYVIGTGMAQATAVLTGRAIGRGEDPANVARDSMRATALLTGGVGLALFVLAEPIAILVSEPPASALTITWIRVLGVSMPLVGVCAAMRGVFRGAGRTSIDSTLCVIAVVGVQLPVGYALGHVAGLGPLGVWLGFPVAFAVRALMQRAALRPSALAVSPRTEVTARGL